MSDTTALPAGRDRGPRLFACACARRIWGRLTDWARQAVEAAERYADGAIDWRQLAAARKAAGARYGSAAPKDVAANVASYTALPSPWGAFHAVRAALPLLGDAGAPGWEQEAHAEVYGPKNVSFDLAWLAWNGRTVARLARGIYDEQAFDQLPVLADALEDAGCRDEAILAHCRGGGAHERGCWVLRRLLERD